MQDSVQVEYAYMKDFDDFDLSCTLAYEAAFESGRRRGVKVKELFICNPDNPLSTYLLSRKIVQGITVYKALLPT